MEKYKIKDNVDLKELENYGFKKDRIFGYILLEKYNNNFDKIIAKVSNGILEIHDSNHKYEIINKIKHLLQ